MITLDELFKEFSGKTSLQQAEHLKRRGGVGLEIVAELGNIDTDHLRCWNFKPEISSSNSIHIMHKGEQLRKQLLEYSNGDLVRMNIRFTGANFDYDSNRWTFDLVSIVRLCTREAKAKRIDEANLRRARLMGVVGLFAGAVAGIIAGLVLCILLVNI